MGNLLRTETKCASYAVTAKYKTNVQPAPKITWVLFRPFRCIIHKQCVQIQTVGKNEVSDVVPSQTQMIQRHRVLSFDRHFDGFQMSVHCHVHACSHI